METMIPPQVGMRLRTKNKLKKMRQKKEPTKKRGENKKNEKK
jgi:hypothetical protein